MTAAEPAVTREEWDRLVLARVEELCKPDAYLGGKLTREQAVKAAEEDAALMMASATEFADAVDRSGKGIPYGEAVIIEGSAGPLVITEQEEKDSPAYWRTVASGAGGRIDRVEHGRYLLHYLRTGENLDAPAVSTGAHAAP